MNRYILLVTLCLASLVIHSCRTAKAKYTPVPGVRGTNVQARGANQCQINGDLVSIDFPEQANCTGSIWDFQRGTCANHLTNVNCRSYADIRAYVSQINSNATALDQASAQSAKILACGQRENSQFNDYTVQVVYPPDNKSNFTQQACELGVNFRVETICFRVCKTQACQTGVVTGTQADALVFDCLQP